MKAKFTPSFSEEKKFWDKGIEYVIGIDEVGRGAFAGPVVVAGTVFHPDCSTFFEDKASEMFSWLHQIHDSKLLSKQVRETLSPLIRKQCMYSAITEIGLSTINTVGIGKAVYIGMRQIIKNIQRQINSSHIGVLVDAFTIPHITVEQIPVTIGDQKSISIAAASIIAKVHRDSLMDQLSKKYPLYLFHQNKGYGTQFHRNMIKSNGICKIHRKSFNLKKYLSL